MMEVLNSCSTAASFHLAILLRLQNTASYRRSITEEPRGGYRG